MIVPQDHSRFAHRIRSLLDAGQFTTYQWMKDGAVIPTETNRTFKARASGTYSAQVTNAAGCSGTSQNVSVTINPIPPQPVITASGNVLTSTSAVSYQWFVDGNPISGATSQSFTPTTGGNFTVQITDANGCKNISQPVSNAGSTLIAVPAMVMANQSDHITIPLSIQTSQAVPAGVDPHVQCGDPLQ